MQADETFVELAQMIMDDNNLQIPRTPVEASNLCSEVLYHIESMIWQKVSGREMSISLSKQFTFG